MYNLLPDVGLLFRRGCSEGPPFISPIKTFHWGSEQKQNGGSVGVFCIKKCFKLFNLFFLMISKKKKNLFCHLAFSGQIDFH